MNNSIKILTFLILGCIGNHFPIILLMDFTNASLVIYYSLIITYY